MKTDKTNRAAILKTRLFNPKDRSAVSHAIHELVADEDERKKLMKATHNDRVAVLKKNGYKFSK